MTKKDIYKENPLADTRTYINGETAIKPYYYMRCGLLHARYTVDRAISLSKAEEAKIKVDLASGTEKQEILGKAWNILEKCVEKPIILDGITEADKLIEENKNGRAY